MSLFVSTPMNAMKKQLSPNRQASKETWSGSVSLRKTQLCVFMLSFLSGFISLGYQVLWFRIYADWFGSTNRTFLLVLISFIGGLGLGSLASGRLATLAAGKASWLKNPIALVGIIEVGIAVTALLTLIIDPLVSGAGGAFPYRPDSRGIHVPVFALQLGTSLAAGCILLPTFLMGTTFPLLCHAFRGKSLFPSELYAWNTMGACSGVLATEFLLLVYLGHTRAFICLAASNAVLAIVFLLLSSRYRAEASAAAAPAPMVPPRTKSKRPPESDLGFTPATILVVAALSGFFSGALEVDMFRAVRFAGAITDAAMSFTSFWAIVAIFLASWTVRALGKPKPMLIRVAVIGALLVYAVTWSQLHEIRGWFNNRYMGWLAEQVHHNPLVAELEVFPFSASLLVALGFTGAVVFPAYFMVSLLLPTVCNMVQGKREPIGRAYGVNTLAFCAGAVLFSAIAPRVNLFYAVKLLFVVLAIAAVLLLTLRPGRALRLPAVSLALLGIVAAAILVPRGFDKDFFPSYEAPAKYPVRAMRSNGANTTFVVESPEGNTLYFDSYPMSGTQPAGQQYMRLMAHMPLLTHPQPRRALLICFGVGNTAAAIAAHESIERIDVVDLNDKVFETAGEFAQTNGDVIKDRRVRLIHDDGRRYLARTRETYDLVTSEPPPPRAAGVYRLYSVEYYRAILNHLSPQGLMTQWLPINMLSRESAHRMIASFVEVFPHALLFIGAFDQLIMLGSPAPFDPAVLEKRFGQSPGVQRDLAGIGIREPLQMFARITAIDDTLRAGVHGTRVISDQRNDLALVVSTPLDPPFVPNDPLAVLQALQPDRLACGKRLRDIAVDRRAWRALVPDAPRILEYGK